MVRFMLLCACVWGGVFFIFFVNILPCACFMSVPFPVSLLCSFQPIDQEKQVQAAGSLCKCPLKKKHSCWYHPWATPVMPTCFSAAHHPQEPRTSLSACRPMHTPQGETDGNCGLQRVWKPVVLPEEVCHSRRWRSRSGGVGWRSLMGFPGQGGLVVPTELGADHDPALSLYLSGNNHPF